MTTERERPSAALDASGSSSSDIIDQVRRAYERRRPLLESGIEALRLFDRAADGIPRLVIEQFGTAIRITAGPERAALLEPIRQALGAPPELFWRFGHEQTGGPEGDDGRRTVTEHGLRYEVRLLPDLHTGLFLEARDLRRWVRDHSAGRRVLNLFAYTCAFGVAAAAGGARATTNVDTAGSALDRGRRNYELNGLPFDTRAFWKSDVFEALKRARSQGAAFDAIVLHPPPVASAQRGGRRTEPVRDLQKVVELCKAVLAPGGWLLLAWTSGELTDLELQATVGMGPPFWTGSAGSDFLRTAEAPAVRAFAFERKALDVTQPGGREVG